MTWQGRDVTVVIPTYNRAALLERAIASVQAQTELVGAVIVVDDGSTDATRDTLQRLSSADPRIVAVFQANAGANAARNAGIGRTSTPLVAFLDSDDRWEPTKIARQLQALQKRPDAVASFTGIVAMDGDRELYHYDVPANPSLLELRRHNALGTTSSALVRKDVLQAVGGFDVGLPSCQDWDLWLRLRKAGEFTVVTDSLVLYDDGPHERITGNIEKALAGHHAVFGKALAGVAAGHERTNIKASHAEVLSRLYKRAGRRAPASYQALRSLLSQPSLLATRRLAKMLLT